jgi:hypothetical protein
MAYATLRASHHVNEPHVRLVMTKQEHNDLIVAMQLACVYMKDARKKGEKQYLERLRKLYDFVFKLEDMTK